MAALLLNWKSLWPYQADRKELLQVLRGHCWIGYDPRDFSRSAPNPSPYAIQRDLEQISAAGFTGVVTYSSRGTLAGIPAIAKRRGLGVIMGIWNPNDPEELARAINARAHVDAYCVGHDGLGPDYFADELKRAISFVSNQARRPATTTQESQKYLNNRDLQDMGDWLFPDIHVSARDIHDGAPAVDVERDIDLSIKRARDIDAIAMASNRPLVLSVVTYPWAGAAGANLEVQRRFFAAFLSRLTDQSFGIGAHPIVVGHSAFDQPWKTGEPFEPWDRFTGLLDIDGKPRPAAKELANRWRR